MFVLTINDSSARWVRVPEGPQPLVPDRLQGLIAGEGVMTGGSLLLALLVLLLALYLIRRRRAARYGRALQRGAASSSHACDWQRLPSSAVVDTGSRWFCTTCQSEGVSYNNRPPKTCKRMAALPQD